MFAAILKLFLSYVKSILSPSKGKFSKLMVRFLIVRRPKLHIDCCLFFKIIFNDCFSLLSFYPPKISEKIPPPGNFEISVSFLSRLFYFILLDFIQKNMEDDLVKEALNKVGGSFFSAVIARFF